MLLRYNRGEWDFLYGAHNTKNMKKKRMQCFGRSTVSVYYPEQPEDCFTFFLIYIYF